MRKRPWSLSYIPVDRDSYDWYTLLLIVQDPQWPLRSSLHSLSSLTLLSPLHHPTASLSYPTLSPYSLPLVLPGTCVDQITVSDLSYLKRNLKLQSKPSLSLSLSLNQDNFTHVTRRDWLTCWLILQDSHTDSTSVYRWLTGQVLIWAKRQSSHISVQYSHSTRSTSTRNT